MAFFSKLEQLILKIIWNHKRPHIAQEILRKKMLPHIKPYCKAIVIKQQGTSIKADIYVNEIESLEILINPLLSGH